jgi:hypothetical protein
MSALLQSGSKRQLGTRLLKVVAASATLVVTLAGCGQATVEATPEPAASLAVPTAAPTSGPPLESLVDAQGFVSLTEIPAFYLAAVENFPHPLPAGTEWPAGIPSGYNDPHGRYEAGSLGESIASTYWHCAWEGEFLDAHESNDRGRQTAALAMLDIWVSDPYFTEVFEDPEQGWKSYVLEPAKNGELRRMESEHRNCPKPAETL